MLLIASMIPFPCHVSFCSDDAAAASYQFGYWASVGWPVGGVAGSCHDNWQTCAAGACTPLSDAIHIAGTCCSAAIASPQLDIVGELHLSPLVHVGQWKAGLMVLVFHFLGIFPELG